MVVWLSQILWGPIRYSNLESREIIGERCSLKKIVLHFPSGGTSKSITLIGILNWVFDLLRQRHQVADNLKHSCNSCLDFWPGISLIYASWLLKYSIVASFGNMLEMQILNSHSRWNQNLWHMGPRVCFNKIFRWFSCLNLRIMALKG